MRGNKGITLIALIIAIIVLLILAGVSIAMLSGDNGILNQASKSTAYNAIGEVSDEIALTVNEYVTSYYEAVYEGGSYIGAPEEATSVAEAIDDALTKIEQEYTDNILINVEYDTLSSITITYGDYSKTGTIDSTSGAITWGNIQS